MAKKKESLSTDEQSRLIAFRQEWFEIGTSTERADRVRAEMAIKAMYARLKKPEPAVFIWCQSPATSLLAIHFLKSPEFKKWSQIATGASLGASLRDSLRDSLWDSLWASLGDSLGASLWASLRDSLGASLWASLRDSLEDSLRASLWASLGDSLGASLEASLRDSLGDSLRASLRASLRDSLRDSLWASLGASLRDSLEASLRDSLEDSLRASLWASLRDSLRASLRDSLRDSLEDSLSQAWWGQHEGYWISFYVFCRDILGVQYKEEKSRDLDLWRDIAESCCWWWPYENYCVVSERPTAVKMERFNQSERLHCEDGPALAFADGWAVHALHGVRVPATVVETDAGELDARLILSERNAEVRREVARKIGMERVCRDLGAECLDRFELKLPERKYLATAEDGLPPEAEYVVYEAQHLRYELLALDLGDGRKRPYLRMQNPSLPGVEHVEGVGPDCRTVKEALRFRKPVPMQTIPIDNESGEDWWLQGDIHIWPLGAISLKEFPTIIT